jgi:uncharacterized spore protein YtfJ
LISAGFGFGAGGGSGKGEARQKGEGKGEGIGGTTGGAAGVKPVAVIVIDKDGVRLEEVKGSMASTIESIGETIPRLIERRDKTTTS